MKKIIAILVGFLISGCSADDWAMINEGLQKSVAELKKQQQSQSYTPPTPQPAYNPQIIYTPPQKPTTTTSNIDYLNGLIIKVKNAITPTNPTVRTFALKLARYFPGNYNTGQICAIWYYVKENWGYVNDPRSSDYFAPAYESINANLSGDCDDFAILLASLIEAIGGSSRIIIASNNQSGHAYCEVLIGNNPQSAIDNIRDMQKKDDYKNKLRGLARVSNDAFYFRKDNFGNYWLNLDWFASHPGSPYFLSDSEMAIYPNGKYEILKAR